MLKHTNTSEVQFTTAFQTAMEDLISKGMLDHTAFNKIRSGYKMQEVLVCQQMLFAVVPH